MSDDIERLFLGGDSASEDKRKGREVDNGEDGVDYETKRGGPTSSGVQEEKEHGIDSLETGNIMV